MHRRSSHHSATTADARTIRVTDSATSPHRPRGLWRFHHWHSARVDCDRASVPEGRAMLFFQRNGSLAGVRLEIFDRRDWHELMVNRRVFRINTAT